FFILALGGTILVITALLLGGVFMTRLTLDKARDAEQKTTFVASVSHELKTPLTSIRMYAELLLSGRIKDEAKQKKYLEILVGESLRLTRLINNVLDFGRLEQKRKSYACERFDLVEFMVDLIAVHGLPMEKSGFKITTQFPPGPMPVYLDKDVMEQVILNLMDNALKYAASGKSLGFTMVEEKGEIILGVMDRGPGIPSGLEEKIFKQFFRADNRLTAARSGSGLGLTLARQMIRDMGGDLFLETGQATGACFTLRMKKDGTP
ncbi:MAG: HAMP domain-containing histidine kinase, partial [Desulfobacterales bacterium]|nr:HAMP domain-containing histidine kinase [Desulfobacterales bacterium]